MSEFPLPLIWVGVFIALVPAFGFFAYLARWRRSLWISFDVGAAGWTAALLLRAPILQILGGAFFRNWIVSFGAVATYISIGISSLLAGLFEEGIRYGLVKKIQLFRRDSKHILSMGLGWGFGEALLIYAVNIVFAVYLKGQTIPISSLMLGALERNVAIALHVGLTFVIWTAVNDSRFLLVAIGIHFLIDFVGVSLFTWTKNIWTTYAVALIIDLILIAYAYRITKGQTTPSDI
jgi:uncharacterized membrane protein YhfC